MCGRFIFVPNEDEKEFFDTFHIDQPIELEPNYNVSPTQLTPVITKNSPNKAQYMQWGLIARWAKNDSYASKLINARIETLTEKPSFRYLVNSNRCLIPCSGYYEWSDHQGEKKPYLIHHSSNNIMAFGGLYDLWESPKGETIKSFSIITRSAQKEIELLHERMPLIIDKSMWDRWLDVTIPYDQVARAVLIEQDLEYYEVTKAVNYPGNNSPSLIEPIK